jgi:hypothetical protein
MGGVWYPNGQFIYQQSYLFHSVELCVPMSPINWGPSTPARRIRAVLTEDSAIRPVNGLV